MAARHSARYLEDSSETPWPPGTGVRRRALTVGQPETATNLTSDEIVGSRRVRIGRGCPSDQMGWLQRGQFANFIAHRRQSPVEHGERGHHASCHLAAGRLHLPTVLATPAALGVVRGAGSGPARHPGRHIGCKNHGRARAEGEENPEHHGQDPCNPRATHDPNMEAPRRRARTDSGKAAPQIPSGSLCRQGTKRSGGH